VNRVCTITEQAIKRTKMHYFICISFCQSQGHTHTRSTCP